MPNKASTHPAVKIPQRVAPSYLGRTHTEHEQRNQAVSAMAGSV
jgi:hypothetical protein